MISPDYAFEGCAVDKNSIYVISRPIPYQSLSLSFCCYRKDERARPGNANKATPSSLSL
jgi:hypothetical protein